MGNAITPMGKKWEYLHSIWMMWLLFPFGFFSFISFFYISLRVKKLKWFIAGIIYLLIVIQFFVLDEFIPEESFIFDLSVMLTLGGWIAAWVNAVLSRRTYLQLLAQKKAELQGISAYDETHYWDALDSTSQSESVPEFVEQPVPSSQQVNMNTATKEEIMTIPSVESILAGQIVEIRRRRGPFLNFSHFTELMDMEPHMLAEANPFMIFIDDDLERTEPQLANAKNQISEKSI